MYKIRGQKNYILFNFLRNLIMSRLKNSYTHDLAREWDTRKIIEEIRFKQHRTSFSNFVVVIIWFLEYRMMAPGGNR